MTCVLPALQAALLCDAIAEGPDGRKTLYGVLDRVVAGVFPHTMRSLAVYTAWSGGMGEHSLEVRIHDDAGTPCYQAPRACVFRLESPLVRAEIVHTIRNLTLPQPGHYLVALTLSGSVAAAELPLMVEHARPAPFPARREERSPP